MYPRFLDVPDRILRHLKRLCYPSGFMHELLTDSERGIGHKYLRYVTVYFDPRDIPVAWAVRDDRGEVHLWTDKKYRGQGLAPRLVVCMMRAMTPGEQKKLKAYNDSGQPHVTIGKYLYRNNLV